MSRKYRPDGRMRVMAEAREDISIARKGNEVIASMLREFLEADPELVEESAIASAAQMAMQVKQDLLIIMLAVALYDEAARRDGSS